MYRWLSVILEEVLLDISVHELRPPAPLPSFWQVAGEV